MNNNENKDDITIIDLLTVFIKYRKLIIIGTLICFAICAISLGIIRFYQKRDTTKPITTVSNQIKLNKSLSNTIIKLLNEDYETVAFSVLTSPKMITEACLSNNILKKEVISKKERFNFYKKQMPNIKIVLNESQNDIYTVSYTSTDDSNIQKNFDSMINNLSDLIFLQYLDVVKEEIKNVKQEILNYDSSKKAYQSLLNEEKILVDYCKQGYSFLKYTKASNIITVSKKNLTVKQFITMSIISFFASLFLFIIISFICNYISNIKKDKIIMEKITQAWIDGK